MNRTYYQMEITEDLLSEIYRECRKELAEKDAYKLANNLGSDYIRKRHLRYMNNVPDNRKTAELITEHVNKFLCRWKKIESPLG